MCKRVSRSAQSRHPQGTTFGRVPRYADVHFAGFAAGAALGIGLAYAGQRLPQGTSAQRAFGATALAVFALAWLLALRAHG